MSERSDLIFGGPMTLWLGPLGVDVTELGPVCDDERWELIYPAVPDDASELEEEAA